MAAALNWSLRIELVKRIEGRPIMSVFRPRKMPRERQPPLKVGGLLARPAYVPLTPLDDATAAISALLSHLEQCFLMVWEISSGSWLTAALHHSEQLNWLIA